MLGNGAGGGDEDASKSDGTASGLVSVASAEVLGNGAGGGNGDGSKSHGSASVRHGERRQWRFERAPW